MEKIIEIDLIKKDDVFEKYNKNIISKDLINYIVDEAFYVKNEKLKLVINNYTSDSFKEKIENALIDEYNNSITNNVRSNKIQATYLFVGMLAIFLSTLIEGTIFEEIILIGGWVLIWSMMELMLFSDTKSKRKRVILKNLLKNEIIENMK